VLLMLRAAENAARQLPQSRATALKIRV